MKIRILTMLTIFLIVLSTLNVVSTNITDENPTDIAKTDRIKESEDAKRTDKKVIATSEAIRTSPLMTDTTVLFKCNPTKYPLNEITYKVI